MGRGRSALLVAAARERLHHAVLGAVFGEHLVVLAQRRHEADDRDVVGDILAGTGCERLF